MTIDNAVMRRDLTMGIGLIIDTMVHQQAQNQHDLRGRKHQ